MSAGAGKAMAGDGMGHLMPDYAKDHVVVSLLEQPGAQDYFPAVGSVTAQRLPHFLGNAHRLDPEARLVLCQQFLRQIVKNVSRNLPICLSGELYL